VFDENHIPLSGAEISYADKGVVTNSNGFYRLEIPANRHIKITVSYIGLKKMTFTTQLKSGEVKEFNPILKSEFEQIGTVIITGDSDRPNVEAITTIPPEVVRTIPGANAGVENLLKTLPGVNSNNELSTQYSVRGGN